MNPFSILRNSLLLINLLCAALFLLSCLAPFVSPERFWPLAFIGLGFLPLLIANLFWIVFWLLFGIRFALVSMTALLLGSWNIGNHFSVASVFSPPRKGAFSVMSFNVKVFDLYTWNNYPKSKDDLLWVIENANPDVLCLQEFYVDDSEQPSALASLKERYPYFHFQKTLTLQKHKHWGIATFSKFPIARKNVIPFPDSFQNLAIATDIIVKNDTLRIFNAHLQSIYISSDDYDNMLGFNGSGKIRNSIWNIIRKMKEGFIKRSLQADLIAGQIAASPYDALVCADFNDTPNSYTYRILTSGLQDSFKEAGFGIGCTFSSRRPVFRIDYILAKDRLRICSHKVIGNSASDHFAVMATFERM